ncbi:MAG TPA: signal peptidase I [Candidatus Angelobacter sp.]
MTDPQNPVPAEAGVEEQTANTLPDNTASPEETAAAADAGPRGLTGLASFLQVVVIVIFVVTFVVQAFQVPTGSMENTLLVGDFLLTDKIHYGKEGGIWNKMLPYRPIQRGDIIVFHSPVDPSLYLVKRVIGLPGDRIRLRRGAAYVNGQALSESYAIHTNPYFDSYRDEFPAQPYSIQADRKWRRNMPEHVQNGELVVPAGAYFALGDNRDNSLDSRYWGFVPRDNVVGRPLVIYMSVNHGDSAGSRTGNDKLIHSGEMPAHFLPVARWSRIFRLVR